MFWVFGSLHLPAVTSASEVLTQTNVARSQWSFLRRSVFESELLFSLLALFKNVAVSKNKKT